VGRDVLAHEGIAALKEGHRPVELPDSQRHGGLQRHVVDGHPPRRGELFLQAELPLLNSEDQLIEEGTEAAQIRHDGSRIGQVQGNDLSRGLA